MLKIIILWKLWKKNIMEIKTNNKQKLFWYRYFTSVLPMETRHDLAKQMEPYTSDQVSWKIFKAKLKPLAAKARKKHRDFYHGAR